MSDESISTYQLIIGYLAGISSVITVTAATACAQALQGVIPNFELSAFRGVFQIPIYLVIGFIGGSDLKVEKTKIFPIICLGLLYAVKNACFYGSAKYIPLAEILGVTSIFTTLSSIIHAKFVYKKVIKKLDILSLIICTVGILLIIQPHFLLHDTSYVNKNTTKIMQNRTCLYHNSSYTEPFMVKVPSLQNGKNRQIGYLLVSVAGITRGMSFNVNGYGLSGVEPIVKAIHFSNWYFLFSILSTLYLEPVVYVIASHKLFYIVGYSLLSAVSSYANIFSVHHIGSVRSSFVYSLDIIFALFIQYIFMKSIMPGHRNWMEVVGAAIMITGVALIPINDMIQNLKQSNTLP